jgi:endonuclease/exonuclease/phosphatase (EEP) superfamily protein YafD
MILFFSSQVRKTGEEILDFFLVIITLSIISSFFSSHIWFLNLCDQLWLYYLATTLFLSILYIYLKKIYKATFSVLILIICLWINLSQPTSLTKDKFQSQVTIYYHNINKANNSVGELLKNIRKINADIVLLTEVTPAIKNILNNQLKDYQYWESILREDNFGFSILSNQKFIIQQIYEKHGVPLFVKIYFENLETSFYLVHLPPPLWGEAVEDQIETLNYISDEIIKKKSDQFLLLGDFNMTPQSKIFSNFYKKLNPKYNSLKNLLMGTWPAILPKYLGLSIDHVFSNRVIDVELGKSSGSDHRALLIRM